MENWTSWILGLGAVALTVFVSWLRDKYLENLDAMFSPYQESREADTAWRFYIEALRQLHELILLVALIGLFSLAALILILLELKGL